MLNHKDSVFVKKYTDTDSTVEPRKNQFSQQEFRQFIFEQLRMARERLASKHILPDTVSLDKKLSKKASPWTQFKIPAYLLKKDTFLLDEFAANWRNIADGYEMHCTAAFASAYEMDMYLAALDRTKLENSTFVRIPILGIAFDVNWLIVVSGVGFLLIYFLLYYALGRERKNIMLLFMKSEKEGIPKKDIYQYMSMEQVFTIPYSINEALDDDHTNNQPPREALSNRIKRTMPKITWAIPFFIWLAIFLYDWHTAPVGRIINALLLKRQTIAAIVIGLGILYLALLCIWESLRIDKCWKEQALAIFKEKGATGNDPELPAAG